MNGDRLVIECGGVRLALGTSDVAGIVEVSKVPYLPGQSRFVNGIISFRNEPVAVVDIRKVFQGLSPEKADGEKKIIVLKQKGRTLGIEIGSARIFFIWNREAAEMTPGVKGQYIEGKIELEDGPVYILDWRKLFDETARILSLEEENSKGV